MRRLLLTSSLILAGVLGPGMLPAQIPVIVRLPDSDFAQDWGRTTRLDDFDRPDFKILGRQERFLCTLTGAFRPNSRYNDQFVVRDMEAGLISTPYFIEATYDLMNSLDQSRDLQWALLECVIPDTVPEEEAELIEREDEALERARRAQERRRARDK